VDKEKATQIVEALNDECVDASVYDEYSGRGMYGSTTTAVRCADLERTVALAGEYGVKRPRWDQLGKGFIVY